MRRLRSRRARWIGGFPAIAMTLVSLFANSVQTDQDKQKVARMTNKMKTMCVGRFLIDLPVEAEVSISRGYVSGFDLSSTVQESDAEFWTRLETVESEIASGRKQNTWPMNLDKLVGFDDAKGKIWVYNYQRTTIPKGERKIEIEDVSVRSVVRFPGLSITASADGLPVSAGERLEQFLKQLRPLDGDEVPVEPGFCIGHAIVRDPYEHRNTESVVLFAGLPGHPDVSIVFSTMAGTAPAPGLLERNAAAAEREPFFVRMAFTTLHEGKRIIHGLSGEELALRVRESNFTTGYSFQWEAPGKQKDIHAPLLTLELDAGTNPVNGGKPVQSTLSEEALKELWEQIAGSIRVRPTETRSSVTPEPAIAALGTSVIAGETCPQTGWWQCSDEEVGVGIHGGQRQFLKAGQRMPQALLLPQQTLWQRLRGVQPSYESRNPSFWKLVDKRCSARLPSSPMLASAMVANENIGIPAGAVPYGISQVPIGSVSKTGSACPASGWWRCEDSHALDGTRWFAAGSLLPPATFRAPVPLRGSMHREHIHRRSAWLLVRLAEGNDGHEAFPHFGQSQS